MTVLVCGGAASGKSRCAEELLCKLSRDVPRVYLATMRPFGDEAAARIAKHRAQRVGRGFLTVECYVNLESAPLPPDTSVLLEDIGNLCANELFDPEGGGADAVLRGVDALKRRSKHLVIVSNEVTSGGTAYGEETLLYMRTLAELNRRIASMADAVCEVVCGVAEYYKGEAPI